MRVLSSLKASPRGASHSASLALTCPACCLAVAEHDHVVGVSDQHRGTSPGIPGVLAGRSVTDPGGLLQPVQRDVQEQRADHAALWSSFLRRREPFARLEHPRFQPACDHVPGGERSESTSR